jgi:hypothetical protein
MYQTQANLSDRPALYHPALQQPNKLNRQTDTALEKLQSCITECNECENALQDSGDRPKPLIAPFSTQSETISYNTETDSYYFR